MSAFPAILALASALALMFWSAAPAAPSRFSRSRYKGRSLSTSCSECRHSSCAGTKQTGETVEVDCAFDLRCFWFWHITTDRVLTADGRFSNRPVGVKHFQTIHHCSVDVAHGLALLFELGTKALVWGFFFSQEV